MAAPALPLRSPSLSARRAPAPALPAAFLWAAVALLAVAALPAVASAQALTYTDGYVDGFIDGSADRVSATSNYLGYSYRGRTDICDEYCLGYQAGYSDGSAALGEGYPIAVYRLLNPIDSTHLFTTDFNEYSILPTVGWIPEGVAFLAFDLPLTVAGVPSVPLYRVFNLASGQHLLTTDENEYAYLASLPGIFQAEGVVAHIPVAETPQSLPLYRLRYGDTDLHLYTSDYNEAATLSGFGWIVEGVVGYVLP
jgi:hypothetical protein